MVGAKATAVPRLWGETMVVSVKNLKGRREAYLHVTTDEAEPKRGGCWAFRAPGKDCERHPWARLKTVTRRSRPPHPLLSSFRHSTHPAKQQRIYCVDTRPQSQAGHGEASDILISFVSAFGSRGSGQAAEAHGESMTLGDGDRRCGATLPEPVSRRQLEDAGVANMVLVSLTDVKGQRTGRRDRGDGSAVRGG